MLVTFDELRQISRRKSRVGVRKLKPVVFYCPGCRKKVTRALPRAVARYKSLCAATGRIQNMRKLRHQP